MKKMVRYFVFCLVLAGTVSALSAKSNAFFGGDPVPLCDPDNPGCSIIPK